MSNYHHAQQQQRLYHQPQRTMPYRPSTQASPGSITQTITQHTHLTPVLRLRAEPGSSVSSSSPSGSGSSKNRRRIQWAEDVIDNEGMGKKSSKVCCIYHAPRPVGESSDESSSSSESDSDTDSDVDDGRARMGPNRRQRRNFHPHHSDNHPHGEHNHGDADDIDDGTCRDHDHTPGTARAAASGSVRKPIAGRTVPGVTRNAYERMPKAAKAVEVKS